MSVIWCRLSVSRLVRLVYRKDRLDIKRPFLLPAALFIPRFAGFCGHCLSGWSEAKQFYDNQKN